LFKNGVGEKKPLGYNGKGGKGVKEINENCGKFTRTTIGRGPPGPKKQLPHGQRNGDKPGVGGCVAPGKRMS